MLHDPGPDRSSKGVRWAGIEGHRVEFCLEAGWTFINWDRFRGGLLLHILAHVNP